MGHRFPVTAAINGAIAGVSLVMACFCDMRFAAAEAKLSTAAPKLGLPAETKRQLYADQLRFDVGQSVEESKRLINDATAALRHRHRHPHDRADEIAQGWAHGLLERRGFAARGRHAVCSR